MPKIAIIGAGGFVFPLTIFRDVVAFPELRESTVSLMDIAPERLERTAAGARALAQEFDLPTVIESTTDRRESLDGADFVVVCWQVGGLEAYRTDVEIPREYGVDQPVGDTMGPGGIFRGLRTIEALKGFCADARGLCPDALVLNYANPMAINTWATYELGVEVVGLCHSVQGTSALLAAEAGVPAAECNYRAAGLNHQAWFVQFEHRGRDLLPVIRRRIYEKHVTGEAAGERSDDLYAGGNEAVRGLIMQLTGYFHSESSHHGSEYVPWFRKDAERVAEYLPRRWDYYDICCNHDEEGQNERFLAESRQRGLKPGQEYGAYIIHSLTTGQPRVIHGSVRNEGIISNLPEGCAVEVPCLVDANGVQPTVIGDLPPACAAVNRACVSVQELAVKAGLTGDRDLARAAVAMDPLTGAVCTLEEVREMVDRLFEAQAEWLPSFAR
ncbi:MAG: alpha-galactosidase [Planctomycetes bacterium SM23_32]|nr:MAG: alpha-galactosidase [Planctomycetes bacterium SM23_32]